VGVEQHFDAIPYEGKNDTVGNNIKYTVGGNINKMFGGTIYNMFGGNIYMFGGTIYMFGGCTPATSWTCLLGI
jgi:hypothetical protein